MNITKAELLRQSQDKLADIILAMAQKSSDAGKHLRVILAGCDPDPTRSILMIKEEIASLRYSASFVGHKRSFDFAFNIEQVRKQIIEDVLPKSPNEAVTLLRSLIDITENTMERVDDSSCSVVHAFNEVCRNLAEAYEQATYPLNDMVDFVYNCLMNDEFRVYQTIIHDFKTALGIIGLQALQQKFQNSEVIGYKVSVVRVALCDIADACNDVNAYIEACSFGLLRPAAHKHIDIAKRLIDHGRGREAIPWLDSADVPAWEVMEMQELRQKALEQSCDVAQLELAE